VRGEGARLPAYSRSCVVAALGSFSREVLHKRPWHAREWNRWTLADISGSKRPASFPGNHSGLPAASAKLWNQPSSARKPSTRQTIAWIALIENCAEPIDFRPFKGPEVKFCY